MSSTTKPARPGNVTVEDARIIFKNFAGKPTLFNTEGGVRSFGLILPPELAAAMEADQWAVKYLKPREEGDEPQPWVEVTVSYKLRPPRVVMITHRPNPATGEMTPVRVALTEDVVEMVDYADIEKVDVIINPSVWGPISGRYGIKAYLQTMFITIRQDELEQKYAAVPELDLAGQPLQIAGVPNFEGDYIDPEWVVEEEMQQLEG